MSVMLVVKLKVVIMSRNYRLAKIVVVGQGSQQDLSAPGRSGYFG